MACGGVIASAGAQISVAFVTVKERSQAVGKSTIVYHGHSGSYSGSSVSNNPMEFADGTSSNLVLCEGGNTSVSVGHSSMPTNASDYCNTMCFTGSNGSRETKAMSGVTYRPGGTDSLSFTDGSSVVVNLFANSEDEVLIFELRAD
jgi:hypothetical protein